MKKLILSVAAVMTFGFANAQSHEKGDIQAAVLFGTSVGAGTDSYDAINGNKAYDIKADLSSTNFGVDFQYGIADQVSLGLGLDFGTNDLTPTTLTDPNGNAYSWNGYYESMSHFKVGVSGRYYILNKDKFNLFFGPKVGYVTGKEKAVSLGLVSISLTDAQKYTGFNYGGNVGANYYFIEHVGATLQMGYDGNSLKGKATTTQDAHTRNFGGFKIMGGVTFKF